MGLEARGGGPGDVIAARVVVGCDTDLGEFNHRTGTSPSGTTFGSDMGVWSTPARP